MDVDCDWCVMRRSPLQRKTPLDAGHQSLRRSRLNPVSGKRRREQREYSQLRVAFLTGHPYCESPLDCGQRATEIQHRRGRRGARLCDVDWWAASCSPCNQWAETNTGEALESGWLVRIEGVSASVPDGGTE